jgi:hypothetical protein
MATRYSLLFRLISKLPFSAWDAFGGQNGFSGNAMVYTALLPVMLAAIQKTRHIEKFARA